MYSHQPGWLRNGFGNGEGLRRYACVLRTDSSEFFGMHLINDRDWPTVPVDALGKGTGVSWSVIEATKGSYNWARLDEWVNAASSHGVNSFFIAMTITAWAAADSLLVAWGTGAAIAQAPLPICRIGMTS